MLRRRPQPGPASGTSRGFTASTAASTAMPSSDGDDRHPEQVLGLGQHFATGRQHLDHDELVGPGPAAADQPARPTPYPCCRRPRWPAGTSPARRLVARPARSPTPAAPRWARDGRPRLPRCGTAAPDRWQRVHQAPAVRKSPPRSESRREADADRSREALLDVRVERAHHPVELRLRTGRRGAAHRAGRLASSTPDREVRADEPLVPTKEVLVQLAVVLLRRRHHVGLVAQRPLAERQPDGRELLRLSSQADEPAIGLVVIPPDRLAPRGSPSPWRAATRRAGVRARPTRPRRGARSSSAHRLLTGSSARRSGGVGQHSTSAPTVRSAVDAPQPGRGERPRVAARSGRRAHRHLRGQPVVREDLVGVAGEHVGVATLDEEAGVTVVDEGQETADTPTPPLASRTPPPPAPRAQSSPTGSARARRRPPGSSSTGDGEAGARRRGPASGGRARRPAP